MLTNYNIYRGVRSGHCLLICDYNFEEVIIKISSQNGRLAVLFDEN